MPDNEDCSADFPCISPSRNYHTKDTFPLDWEVDPATVGQFTGLYDKNGKKIFEGDVVRIEYEETNYFGSLPARRTEQGVIGYDSLGALGAIIEYYNGVPVWTDFFGVLALTDRIQNWSFEIIGNIHDNQELLEAQS